MRTLSHVLITAGLGAALHGLMNIHQGAFLAGAALPDTPLAALANGHKAVRIVRARRSRPLRRSERPLRRRLPRPVLRRPAVDRQLRHPTCPGGDCSAVAGGQRNGTQRPALAGRRPGAAQCARRAHAPRRRAAAAVPVRLAPALVRSVATGTRLTMPPRSPSSNTGWICCCWAL